MTTTVDLDACGLQCPLPLLKLKQQLNKLAPGDRVAIKTTDPGSVRDFNAFVQQAGHQMLDSSEGPEGYAFLIEKG